MHHTHRTQMHLKRHAMSMSEGERTMSRSRQGGSETTNGEQHNWLHLREQNGGDYVHQPEGKISASERFS